MKPTLCALALTMGVMAQEHVPMRGMRVFTHAVPEGQGPGMFMTEMRVGERVVKGAPYSAQAVTEINQALADGNRIRQRLTSNVYRDSEGRTRREQSLGGLAPLGAAAPAGELIFIEDPVAGIHWILNPDAKTATKQPLGGAIGHRVEWQREGEVRAEVFEMRIARRRPGVPGGEQRAAKPESLGRQVIEGVAADGERTVTTIAAGQIGNDRPIEIVSERWFSPDLKVTVMTRSSDPRMGETSYRLTNISRAEPMRSLFEVPPDYTVEEPKVDQLIRRKPRE